MIGRELKAKLQQLAHQHRATPIERAPLPLLSATTCSQIVEGIASTPDIDSERTSFARGSLFWPPDLSTLPLLIKHDANKIAGRILDLNYGADGRLHIKALVEDPQARRLPAFSICAGVIESEIRDVDSPSGFHAIVRRAVIAEISLTDKPSNIHALITHRRDAGPVRSYDDALAALGRFKKALDAFAIQPPSPATAPTPTPVVIGPGLPRIYGTLPLARMRSRPTSFSNLVSQLNTGG